MKDFYSLFAYFNSIDGSPDGREREGPCSGAPRAVERRAETADRRVAATSNRSCEARLRRCWLPLSYEEPADADAGKTTDVTEKVWVDDAIAAGAKAEGDWKWVAAPAPGLSGRQASTRTATGLEPAFLHRCVGAADRRRGAGSVHVSLSRSRESAQGDHAAVE